MVDIARYKALWSTPQGGAGMSTFWVTGDGVNGQADWIGAVRQFFFDVREYLPNDTIVTFDSEITVHDSLTGDLISARGVVPPAQVAGSSTGIYAAAAGARVEWVTGVIANGRRVRGRTYLVPLVSTAFGTEGALATAAITTLGTAAQTYLDTLGGAGVQAIIYAKTHRVVAFINGVAVPSKGGVLRSRRD